ncbi:MAG: TGS domain-containing protein, partial [Planctomycetaceae bacterium]|nr:TGS domain-containing protein [Planctomycetaceae bacterium]
MNIQLPDGTLKEYPAGSSALDVARSIGERLANATIAAQIGETIVDAMRPLEELTDADPIPLKLLTTKDAEALGVLRHSCAHIMARAVMRLYPGVGLAFGPTTGNGFYYDFDLSTPISEEDFPRIEAEMAAIIKEGEPFERFNLSREEALKLAQDLNQELKCEHIETGLAEHPTLSFYRQGEFVDLCRGPHIPDASKVKAFKLVSVAGSYWKGDSDNKGLQRLYGTAFFDKKDMQAYLDQVEEAKRRDHRVLGKQHGLFSISTEVGQGLALWLPKGAMVRNLLEDFIKQELLRRGYNPVYSPHIGRVELYETSGHFPYYRDSQFAPLFGHPAGSLVDHWKSRIADESITDKVETDFLNAAL